MSTIAMAPKTTTRPAGAFSITVVIALLLVGVFSFSAFFVLSAFAPELAKGDDARPHALSHSAVGFAAAVELARTTGAEVVVSRTPAANRDVSSVVILTPESPLAESDLDALQHQRVLIILPKWLVAPSPTQPTWVVRVDDYDPNMVAAMLSEVAPNATVTRSAGVSRPTLTIAARSPVGERGAVFTPGAIDRLQTIAGENLTPVITTADGRAVVAQITDRPVYVLADPDFLNTQGLADIDTARAGVGILDALRDEGDALVFDVTLNGFERTQSLLRLAFEPPFLGATLSLLAVAVLLAWRSIWRSAPAQHVQRVIALGKRALAENSAALIRLTGREHKMGPGYVQLTIANALELLGLGRAKKDAETAAMLDRIGEAQGASEKFSTLAAEAEAAENGAQVLSAARKLHSWKEEILRATR